MPGYGMPQNMLGMMLGGMGGRMGQQGQPGMNPQMPDAQGQMRRMMLAMKSGSENAAEEEEKEKEAVFSLMDKGLKALKLFQIWDAQGISSVFDGKGFYGKEFTTFLEKKE